MIRAAAEPLLGIAENREEPDDIGGRELRRVLAHHGREPFGQSLGLTADAHEQQGAQGLGCAVHKLTEVSARLEQSVDQREDARRIPPGDSAKHVGVQLVGNQTQHLADARGGDWACSERQHLIEQRQRVAHAAVGALGDQVQRVVLDLELLGLRDLLQPGDDRVWSDPPEIEALQPRQDRRRGVGDLLRLGGGEHEHDTRGRLLENLEQRVPRLAREHVRFVDDVDLGAQLRARRIHRPLAQIARVIDAAVRRGVELDDVEIGRPGPDPSARITLAARLTGRRPPLAVQGHREDARSGGLPHAAGPRKEISVRDAALCHGTSQCGGHMVLSNEIGELFGTVLAS